MLERLPSQSLAERWRVSSGLVRIPIGKCIRTFSRTAPCTSVVGVVGDVHTDGVIEPKPFMHLYLPFAQNVQLDSLRFGPRGIERVLLVRARPGTEGAVTKVALRVARERLPGANELRANDMTQVLEPKLRPWRLGATLFGALGVLAAVVAARRHVQRGRVCSESACARDECADGPWRARARHPDSRGWRRTPSHAREYCDWNRLAVAMGRLVASLLYGVSTRDPVVLGGTGVLLALVGFVATLAPALRAARSDPVSALRAE